MYIVYYDEAGDDGLPGVSPLFTLTATYLEDKNWKGIWENLHDFRKKLKIKYGLPVNMELHTRPFLLNKSPFHTLTSLSKTNRVKIVDEFCELIASLPVRVVNVVINKTLIRYSNYDILEKALTFSLERIEMDIREIERKQRCEVIGCIQPEREHTFMVIADAGRIGSMRRVTRKIQRINYTRSLYRSEPYNNTIKKLIDEPLQKDSSQSYYLQISDLIATLVYIYKLSDLGISGVLKKYPREITENKLESLLDTLRPILNTKVTKEDLKYGIKCHPTN